MKRTYFSVLLSIPVVLAAIVLGELFLPVPSKPFTQLNWRSASYTLIAISDVKRKGENGTLLLRFNDGLEQFMRGDWKVFFPSNSSVYLYGSAPETQTASSTKPLLYNFIYAKSIYSVPIDSISGPIISVEENKDATYLAIGFSTGTQTQYCLAEHLNAQKPGCVSLLTPGIEQVKWDTDTKHELVLRTASGSLFTVDPWEKEEASPKPVIAEKDSTRLEKLDRLFYVPLADSAVSPGRGTRMLNRFLNLVIISDEKGRTVHRLPFGAAASWFLDDSHLLIKETNTLSVYDIESRILYPLIAENGIGSKTILFDKNFD